VCIPTQKSFELEAKLVIDEVIGIVVDCNSTASPAPEEVSKCKELNNFPCSHNQH